MSKEVERIVNADRVEDLIAVFGSFDENVRRIEEALGVRIVSRGDDLKVTGRRGDGGQGRPYPGSPAAAGRQGRDHR